MKKALKALAVASAIWAVTGVGVSAQAAPTTAHHGSALTARPSDTGWG